MASSPWGTIQESHKVEPGIRLVETAGHGGFMVTKRAADKVLLSQAARAHAEVWGGYYCFEEDCLASIILYEVWGARGLYLNTSIEDVERSLETWCVDYLFDLSIEWAMPTA